MDAQGRGRADEIDPADQWVMNPHTGNYELRLDQSAPQSSASPSRVSGARRSRRSAESSEAATPAAGTATRRRPANPATEVPAQRSRRAGGAQGRVPQQQAGRRKRKQAASGKKKALLWTGGTLALLMVATASAGYLYYEHLNSNITSVPDDNAGTGGFSKDRAINILLIGTDKRTGEGNGSYGDKNSPGHADTTLLLHVSKDRTNATALSIPRDLITDIPDCPTTQEDGSSKVIPGTQGTRFNESLGQSGRTPSCTMRTVTELTGIKMDHFMVADFNAVKTLSSAVGGVPICLDKDIKDDKSKLDLPAGDHVLEGEQALAFVRTRHAVGFGGDLDRIKIQQQFLSSLMRKLKSNDTLTSPTKLVKLAEAGTDALTVDSKIDDIGKLRDLGLELGKFDMKNLTFATVPVLDNPAETVKATVVLDTSKSDALFSMVRNDVSLTEVEQKKKAAKDKQAELLKGTRAEASDVRVDVFNGGGPTGSAQKTLDWLQNTEGVLKSTNKGNAPADVTRTTLEYAPNQADQARKLADLMGLPAAALKPGTEDAQGLEAMTLTLGPDFRGAGVPITGPAKAPKDAVQADKRMCAK
ncbi:LCP family protein required for cell wall assembly [Streptomyces sp. V4I23]|uniref:LCP family protein n=1 Tax=Streptomyces sp. V4I23 TaxID=3042282 RepID=UPI002787352B|nr:LCP family protein [Streptomyces sp. V4I23]MDQ1010401.1 LCP family protein required for cell wall assembly [Streptomyces sp. V4I23]